ncbi:Uncharacterised protein [Mycobacteroides abscessus subsp. abscessus]|nr:Uncharacterised protein [Mycobacteroides abscessus subsp. abscessus]
MLARTEHPQDLTVTDDGRHRQDATAQRLAQQVQVGDDALAVAGECRAGTAEA